MTTNTNSKVALVLSGAIILVVIVFIIAAIVQAPPSSPIGQDGSGIGLAPAIREDSHILDQAGEGEGALATYDAADPATAARVKSDFDDGVALGVSSTPAFLVSDQMAHLASFEDLRAAIRTELDR